jgi:quercetin dioxygenase-like cupin family protein
MSTGGHGFFVESGSGRPTRVPVPNAHFKAVGADTNGAYALLEYQVAYDIPLHVHRREDEATYVLEGIVEVRLGDRCYTLKRGDFLFMPRRVPHSITMSSQPPIRILALSTPSGFEHFMEDLAEALAAGHDRSSAQVAAIRAKHQWEPAS